MNNKQPPAQSAQQALFQAVSLCRKAGKLTMGFDAVQEAAIKGKAQLVLVAADTSPKTIQRLKQGVEGLADVYILPLGRQQLAAISHKQTAVFAVTDPNLAKLCCTRLEQCGAIRNDEEEISE